jgi:hypothetical protein
MPSPHMPKQAAGSATAMTTPSNHMRIRMAGVGASEGPARCRTVSSGVRRRFAGSGYQQVTLYGAGCEET